MARRQARLSPPVDQFIYALDARTGKPIATFGDDGRIDLREDLGRDPEARRCADDAGRRFQGPDDRRRTRQRRASRLAGRHPRLRRAHRRAALDVSYHSASRRSRLRDLAEGLVDLQRRRQQLARHGARRSARHRLRADRIGGGRLLRRGSPRRQPLRQLAARARRRHRQAALALPVRAPRHLGPRPPVAAEPRDGAAGRPDDRRRRAGDQARLRVRVRSRERQAALPDRVPEVPGERRAGRSGGRTQPIPTKPAPFARQC